MITRAKHWLKAIGCLGMLACALAQASSPPRIVAINWGLAQTLVALGAPPVGVANIPTYNKWVAHPPLPDSVADVGRRLEPNLTVLAGLKPDLVVMSEFYANLRQRVEPIAPVETLTIYTSGGDPYQRALEVAETLARRTGTQPALERLRGDVEASISELASARRARGGTPSVYVVQFADANHVRVFGDGSMFDAVLERAGFANAWQGAANAWGFAMVEITELDRGADHLIIIEPVRPAADDMMASSPLWSALPATQGRIHRLAPVWAYGGLTSAQRFAELTRNALYGHR